MSETEWKPWENSNVWKSKAEFYSWLRGGIRKSIWTRYPPRNEFKKSNMRNITEEDRLKYNFSKLVKRVGTCEMCLDVFTGKELQVDHMIPAGSLNNENDIKGFIQRIACNPEDMRLVCSNCNHVLAYAERMNMTYDQAFIEKRIIKFINQNSVVDIKKLLDQHSLLCDNEKSRRESIRKLITEGEL
jgi:5-methylcytosine-specific restriction endonuclease McrA